MLSSGGRSINDTRLSADVVTVSVDFVGFGDTTFDFDNFLTFCNNQ